MSTPEAILAEQRVLWGTAPRDWAALAEPENLPLYERMLDAAALHAGAVGLRTGAAAYGCADADADAGAGAGALLDVGCGSGLLGRLAADRGAAVSGIDACPELLAIARERAPAADLREGDLAALPFTDRSFDVVTGANAFQFAPDPGEGFAEAARVLRPGGCLVAAVFAEPERNEGTALHLAMKRLVEQLEGREDGYAPYSLSSAGGLERAVADAGLGVRESGELPVTWRYADREATLRALLCSAGGARAVRVAGREPVVAALTEAMVQFTGADGAVSIHNLFRYVVAER
jgi:SAM-dependent methyltransferase